MQGQPERRDLIKAMFVARKKGMDAKKVDRNLIIGTSAYHVGNIPEKLKPTRSYRMFLYSGHYITNLPC